MKLLWILSLSTTISTSVAWQVDPRCPKERRGLEYTAAEDHKESKRTLNLRGGGTEEQQYHRTLETSPSAFQLKMFWKEGYCWQEEWIERKWCMSCQGGTCSSGEHLCIQFCDAGLSTQRFHYIIAAGGGGQLKTASTNLCLERESNDGQSFKLATCTNSDKQIFHGVQTNGMPFELHPQGSTEMCLTNLEHFPKAQEIIYATSCNAVRAIHTSTWVTYNGGSSGHLYTTASDSTTLRLRDNECSDNNHCALCEGDCDSDEQCMGDLKCFQRIENEVVPGCFGTPIPQRDYCYIPPTPTVLGPNVFAPKLRAPGCSSERPCGVCDGDCDNDNECLGLLVCRQKAGPGYVTGCSGYDPSNTDFCVPP